MLDTDTRALKMLNPKVIRCVFCGYEACVDFTFESKRKKIWCAGHDGWMFSDDYEFIDQCDYEREAAEKKTVVTEKRLKEGVEKIRNLSQIKVERPSK